MYPTVTFNCVHILGIFDPNNCMIPGTQAHSGILTSNRQHFPPCGITLKLMVAIMEQTVSLCEWNDESPACAALFCCVGIFWPQLRVL